MTHGTGRLNLKQIETITKVLSDIKNAGIDVVFVTSGAIGVGMSKLGMTVKPCEVRYKQAAAAVGQCKLMHIYDEFFINYGQVIAQILITRNDIEQPERRERIVDTFNALFDLGSIPIVNENDSTGVEEILFGDNDSLSAEVAVLCKAELLVILSDIDGLYDDDPHENGNAKIIHEVSSIDDKIRSCAGGAGSKLGTGGMITKLHAAELCLNNNIPMVITNGARPEEIYNILNGKISGTLFISK